jgi:hypothetical protein
MSAEAESFEELPKVVLHLQTLACFCADFCNENVEPA